VFWYFPAIGSIQYLLFVVFLSKEETPMSEQQNVKVVQDAYASFGRGDIQAILDSLDEKVEWRMPGEGMIPQAGAYSGRAGVTRFFQILDQTTEFSAFEPREFIAQADRVIALGWYKGKAKATGRSFESPWAMSFTIRDGKILKFEEYTDTGAIAPAFAASASATA
jgi:ketosteroid isomerase-like protein